MTLTLQQWHQRYQQQARWTQNLRNYIYNQVGIKNARQILEVGCGTGVIMDELSQLFSANFYGLDISREPLMMANEILPLSITTQADAQHLPYPPHSFDISLCHFVLLWLKDPLRAVEEMVRVTRTNGFVCALAEPDYGGRIDFPLDLSQIGDWQTGALREQGANPWMGRELRAVFSAAGLRNIEVGVLGGQWGENTAHENFDLEWDVVQSDLEEKREFIQSAGKLKALELSSRAEHRRVLYVPTFYALGKVMT